MHGPYKKEITAQLSEMLAAVVLLREAIECVLCSSSSSYCSPFERASDPVFEFDNDKRRVHFGSDSLNTCLQKLEMVENSSRWRGSPIGEDSNSMVGKSSSRAISVLPNRVQEVNDKIENMEAFLQEMVGRNSFFQGLNKKRKASVSSSYTTEHSILSPSTSAHIKYHLLSESSGSPSSDSSNTGSPESDSSHSSQDSVLDVTPVVYPQFIGGDHPIGILDIWPESVPHLSPRILEEIRIPLSGWNPTTRQISPRRSPNLENPRSQDLMQFYITHTAEMLRQQSPTYVELYRKYIPAMAEEAPALSESLLALAALQLGLQKKDSRLVSIDAATHYQYAIRLHWMAVADPAWLKKDALLATALILAHYEIWNGEHIRMGLHLNGGRDIIQARGKTAHITPLGRALYATFKRMDIITSWVSGNPTFMTHDWWTVDPYTRVPIEGDSPVLLVSDAALAKLSVICCKLTYLKAWATRRRRDLWLAEKEDPSTTQKAQLQARIHKRVTHLEQDLEDWRKEVPDWFDALPEDPPTGGDFEEDINTTRIVSILPRRYPHPSVALVHSWAIGVAIQLFRIRHPDAPVTPPKVGSLCHALLRIFVYMPTDADAALIAPIFAIGMELRQRHHQDWLTEELKRRYDETQFHGVGFLRDGLRFAWMKMEGMSSGRFNRIKEGAAAKIEGVSENLWAAEGMLGTLEKLSLYDSPDTVGKRENYKGEVDMTNLDEDHLPLDVALSQQSTASVSPPPPKRMKSNSPEIIDIDENG